MRGVGFDCFNQVGDQVVALAKVDVDAAERVSHHVALADQAVVNTCDNQDGDNDEADDEYESEVHSKRRREYKPATKAPLQIVGGIAVGGLRQGRHYGADEMKETMTDLFISPRDAAYLPRRRSGKAKWWIAFIIAVLIGIGMNCLASGMTPAQETADNPSRELTESLDLMK